jgi:hypothetical protein
MDIYKHNAIEIKSDGWKRTENGIWKKTV